MNPLLSLDLFANMGPPMYHVVIPDGREKIYALVAVVSVVVGITTGGIWCARGNAIRSSTRRQLLLMCIGSLAVAFCSWWLWEHRNTIVESDWPAWLANSMPELWFVFSVTSYVVISRRVKKDAAAVKLLEKYSESSDLKKAIPALVDETDEIDAPSSTPM